MLDLSMLLNYFYKTVSDYPPVNLHWAVPPQTSNIVENKQVQCAMIFVVQPFLLL